MTPCLSCGKQCESVPDYNRIRCHKCRFYWDAKLNLCNKFFFDYDKVNIKWTRNDRGNNCVLITRDGNKINLSFETPYSISEEDLKLYMVFQ